MLDGTRGEDGGRKTSCIEIIRENIRCMDMTWSETVNLAKDREGWRERIA